MIAVIIDIKESRLFGKSKRKEIDIELRQLLQRTYSRFTNDSDARPMLTQGDSIEMLVHSWKPIAYLFHSLFMKKIAFRVGMGTGEIIVHRDYANECDGPAFWNARDALEETKYAKHENYMAGLRLEPNRQHKENSEVIKALLFLTTLQGMTSTQCRYCYFYIWDGKKVIEIAEQMNTTKGNVSKTLNKTPCYLLSKIIAMDS